MKPGLLSMSWKRLTYFSGFLSCLLMLGSAVAETLIKNDDGNVEVFVSGEIDERDAAAFREKLSELERARNVQVILQSRGGNVAAAMSIGRMIRQVEASTFITGNCFSSCALIFIAGVERYSSGTMGLHRPYLASTPQSRDRIEKAVPRMLESIKSYVSEMGVGDNFYQKMINTDPSRIEKYDRDEFNSLVPAEDPVYGEIVIAFRARRYGLTTDEMRRRDQSSKEVCSNKYRFDLVKQIECQDAERWGLTESVYRDRSIKLRQCDLSEQEKSVYRNAPQKQVRDLPSIIGVENCVREIMRGQRS